MGVVLALCSNVLAQTRPAGGLPSQAELRELFQHERYQDVIRQVVRILPIKGDAAAQWDRQELLVLKAEAHLRLGDMDPAARTFAEAAGATEDPAESATHQVMAVLIRRAIRDVYTPRSGALAGEGLSIVSPDGRRLALRALYDDERDAVQKRLAAAREASDLAALLQGLEVILHLRNFELAAAGGELDSQAVLEPLAARARELIKQQLKTISARAEKLDKAANTRKKMGSHYRKRGLAREEMTELRSSAAESRQFAEAARRFALAAAADALRDDFTRLRLDAQQLAQRIELILGADYGGLYDRN